VRILVDTTAFVALLDRRHSRHWVLRDMLSLLFKADATLVVTNCIVLETFDVLRRRFAARSLRLLALELLPACEVVWVHLSGQLSNLRHELKRLFESQRDA